MFHKIILLSLIVLSQFSCIQSKKIERRWKQDLRYQIDSIYSNVILKKCQENLSGQIKDWHKGISNIHLVNDIQFIKRIKKKEKINDIKEMYLIYGYIMGYDVDKWLQPMLFVVDNQNQVIKYTLTGDEYLEYEKDVNGSQLLNSFLKIQNGGCEYNFFIINKMKNNGNLKSSKVIINTMDNIF